MDELDAKLAEVDAKLKAVTPPEDEGGASPFPVGTLQPGNIDLTQRPLVPNADGSASTVRSMSANVDGKEVLMPTIADDGSQLSNEQAIQRYLDTGKHLGIYDTPENATAAAKAISQRQDQYIFDQLDQRVDAAMKDKGVEYVPPIGSADPQDQVTWVKTMVDFLAGFNHALGKGVSAQADFAHTITGPIRDNLEGYLNKELGTDLADQRKRALASMGLDFLSGSEKPSEMTLALMNKAGIHAYEVQNLANKMGKGSFEALGIWAALEVTAPALAAQSGMSTISYLAKQIGEFQIKHPILALWTGQTGAAGGETAKHVTGSENPLVAFGGELAGGVAGGAVPATGKVAMKGLMPIGKGIDMIADGLPPSLAQTIRRYNPLYQQPTSGTLPEPLADPNKFRDVQRFADDQVIGGQLRIEQAINRAIESIPSAGDPTHLNVETHKAIRNAEKISKRIVSTYWDRVPNKKLVPGTLIRDEVATMRTELKDRPFSRPDDLMDELMGLVFKPRDPETGKIQKAPIPTVERLRNFASKVGHQISEEYAKDAPDEAKIRHMMRLQGIVDDGIAAALPNDTTIAQARAMSKKHNDIFSRGPLYEILAHRKAGDFRLSPGQTVQNLLDNPEGVDSLVAARDAVSSYPRAPTNKFLPASQRGNPFATTPEERQQLDAMVDRATDTVRSIFAEIAAEKGPQEAARFATKIGPASRALGQVSGELEHAAGQVRQGLAERTAIQRSELARFAQADPEKAIQRLWTDKDPNGVAKQLLVSFQGNQNALDGLRSGIVSELLKRSGGDPAKARELLHTTRYRDMFENVLDGDQMKRLNTLIDTLNSPEKSTMRQKIFGNRFSPGTMLSRVIAASIGSHAAHIIGRGNIQVPGMASQAAMRMSERIAQSTMPDDAMALAIVDPRFEKLLYSRIPTNTKEMREMHKAYRRFVYGLKVGTDTYFSDLGADDE
jgi:hypothetical protein